MYSVLLVIICLTFEQDLAVRNVLLDRSLTCKVYIVSDNVVLQSSRRQELFN